MPSREKFYKIFLPLLVLLLGFVVMQLLLAQRRAPEPEARVERGALVEVFAVQPQSHRVMVRGSGTVQARREISIIPRVSGEVVAMGPDFISGGFVRSDDLLFRLDPADYELARQRARATVARAEAQLAEISERADVARQDWEQFQRGNGERLEPSPLALFQPQLQEAQAELAAAEADLAAARLDLERISVHAPFNGRIRQRHLEMGQYIPAGSDVATLTGTDQAEIVVPVPQAELPWLDLPRREADDDGSPARVTFTAEGRDYQWSGVLRRTLGEVASPGRMIQLVVAVDDPYGLQETARPTAASLLPGMFVGVELTGKQLEEVFVLPRRAIRNGDLVWLVDEDQRLQPQPVNIIRRDRRIVIIDQGLTAGDRVVLTEVAGAVEGMLLRIDNDHAAQDLPGPAAEQDPEPMADTP